MYRSSSKDVGVPTVIRPPKRKATMAMVSPPVKNCQPESSTGLWSREKILIKIDAVEEANTERRMNPSPFQAKPKFTV